MSVIATSRRASKTGALVAAHWLSRFKGRLHDALTAVDHAHSQRCAYDQLPDAALCDACLCREDAVGIGGHQEALPFFLQSGFARR